MNETYVAVWGMGSLIVGAVAAALFLIAMIWDLGTFGKVLASVMVICVLSLFAALFVQSAIERQRSEPPIQSTNTTKGR